MFIGYMHSNDGTFKTKILVHKTTIGVANLLMMMKTFALLTLLIAAASASSQLKYPLVRRSDTLRELEDEEIDEMDISFEGSVTDIQELAMQKAINSAAISPIGAFSCPNADIQRLEPLTWVYSIEYEPGSDPQAIINELELALEGTLSPRILACQNEDVADRAIVAVDSSPDDLPEPDGKKTCSMRRFNCFVSLIIRSSPTLTC